MQACPPRTICRYCPSFLSLASLAADASLSYVPCSLRRCAGGESEGPFLPLAPLDALSDSHVRIPTSLFMCAGVPAENQKLLFKGQLKDEQTLQVSVAVWLQADLVHRLAVASAHGMPPCLPWQHAAAVHAVPACLACQLHPICWCRRPQMINSCSSCVQAAGLKSGSKIIVMGSKPEDIKVLSTVLVPLHCTEVLGMLVPGLDACCAVQAMQAPPARLRLHTARSAALRLSCPSLLGCNLESMHRQRRRG